MDLLGRVKQITGMGLKLELDLPHKFFMAGQPIRFDTTIRAEVDTTVRRVIAELVSGEAAPGTPEWGDGPALRTTTIADGFTVEAGRSVHIPASIQLPDDAAPTVNDIVGAHYWTLRVSADVPNAIDPTAIIGIVVAPGCQFEWQTEEPLTVKVDGGRRQRVRARGTYTVVKPEDISFDTLHAQIGPVIPVALEELLNEQPRLLSGSHDAPEGRREIAGALREIVIPRVRDSDGIPLDSVADLTLDEFVLDPA